MRDAAGAKQTVTSVRSLSKQPTGKTLTMTARGLVKQHSTRQLAKQGVASLIRQGTLAHVNSVSIPAHIDNEPKIRTAVLTERYDPNRGKSYPVVLDKYEPPKAKRPNQRRKDKGQKVGQMGRCERGCCI